MSKQLRKEVPSPACGGGPGRGRTAALALILALAVTPASAARLGLSAAGSWGDGEYDSSSFFGEPSFDAPFDVSTGELGFALQSGQPASRFLYRLNVSYVRGEVEYDDRPGARDDLSGVGVTNTIGLRFSRTPGAGAWLGGSFYGGRLDLEGDVGDDSEAFVWGGGPSLGFDVPLGDGAQLGLDVTARFLDANVDLFDNYDIDDVAVRLTLLWSD